MNRKTNPTLRAGVAVCCVCLWAAAWSACGEAKQDHDADLPPCVVKVEPAMGEKNVDCNVREIKVTFDRPMQTDKSWSWITYPEIGVYPGYQGSAEPRWENDGRTCVLPVKLSPDTLYAVGVNSFRHTGFRDKGGRIAVPFAWVFKTRKGQ